MKAIAERPADYDREMKAWDVASDEALTNFESSLEGRVKRTPKEQASIEEAIAIMDKLSKISPGRGEDSTKDIRYWRDKRRGVS